MAEDKQFEPTERRLRQARQRGQAPRSRELTSALSLLLALLFAPTLLGAAAAQLCRQAAACLENMHSVEASPESLGVLFRSWGFSCLSALAPFLLVLVCAAVILTIIQAGPLLTLYPLAPRWERLNPIMALRRLFSTHGLVETAKSLLKVLLVGLVAWLVWRRHLTEILLLSAMEPATGIACVTGMMLELGVKTGLAMAALGAADYLYQRFEHTRSLRMTRQEMKEEMRETEGDPLVRRQLRQAWRRLLRDGTHAKLPQATVVITNPVHIAVALYYGAETAAPVVVGRGRGRLAERIKQLARRYGIPLREQPPLARALYDACPLGAPIPPALYQAVAVILAELYREAAARRQARRQKFAAPG